MHISLSANNKIGFINGSIKAPTSINLKFPIWRQCNNMVLSWILNSVHPDIASSAIYAKTIAKSLKRSQKKKKKLSQENDSRIYQIRQEIIEHKHKQQFV